MAAVERLLVPQPCHLVARASSSTCPSPMLTGCFLMPAWGEFLPLFSFVLSLALLPHCPCLLALASSLSALGSWLLPLPSRLWAAAPFRRPFRLCSAGDSATPTPGHEDPGSHPASQSHDRGLAKPQRGRISCLATG